MSFYIIDIIEDSPILVSMGDPQSLSRGMTYTLSLRWYLTLFNWLKRGAASSLEKTTLWIKQKYIFLSFKSSSQKDHACFSYLLPLDCFFSSLPFFSLHYLIFPLIDIVRCGCDWSFFPNLCEWQEVLLSRKWMGRVSSLICISKNLSDLFLSTKVNQRRAILIVVTRWWSQYIHVSPWAGSVVRGTCLSRREGNGIMRVERERTLGIIIAAPWWEGYSQAKPEIERPEKHCLVSGLSALMLHHEELYKGSHEVAHTGTAPHKSEMNPMRQ